MPELPEVETVKRILESKITGAIINQVEILNQKSFVGDLNQILHQKIVGFSRLGKQLSIHLSNGLLLLIHLKMTGQLILVPPSSRGDSPKGKGVSYLGHPTLPAKTLAKVGNSTRVVFHFSNNSILYFNDQRKFGWIKIMTKAELLESQKSIGLDIVDPSFTFDYFYSQIQKTFRPIKVTLLDQNKFAGIGNIYACDSLFLAKIHPTTPASKISHSQAQALYSAVLSVINESILHGGSTTKDKKYLLPDSSYGTHQRHFTVYQRAGEPCLVCGFLIARQTIGGRGTFFCPQCQQLLAK